MRIAIVADPVAVLVVLRARQVRAEIGRVGHAVAVLVMACADHAVATTVIPTIAITRLRRNIETDAPTPRERYQGEQPNHLYESISCDLWPRAQPVRAAPSQARRETASPS